MQSRLPLPAKPEFDPRAPHAPLRYPPEPRHYGRPPVPPLDRTYREHSVYPPRSPPRPRPSGDTYIAPRTMDTYVPQRPPVDSYVAGYDFRSDDGYRDANREREPARARDWRDYAPQDYYRPKERSSEGDRRVWERDEWRPDRRRWDEAERVYNRERRERSPMRHRDTWSREGDWRFRNERAWEPRAQRSWESRPSRSPPRRIASNQYYRPSESPTPDRGRSRTSSIRRRSPTESAERGRRRPTRSSSGSAKLRDRSLSVSPNNRGQAVSPRPFRHASHPEDDDQRRSRQGSRSPSSLRSKQRDNSRGRYTPSMSPRRESGREEQRSPTPSASRHERSTPARSVEHSTEAGSRSHTPVKREASEELPSSAEERWVESRAEEKGKMKETSSTYDRDGDVKMEDLISASPTLPVPQPAREERSFQLQRRRSRSPPIVPRNNLKSPIPPASPRTPRMPSLPAKPDWVRRATTSSTPAHNAAPAEATATVQPEQRVPWMPKLSVPAEIEAEITRLQTHRAHLTKEYASIAKATRRALHELDMSTIDLKLAEQRRMIANKHLELARAGVIGIDYVG